MATKYYGQYGEDSHIHKKYFPAKRNGVFLELGAIDGVKYSNTKFFEDALGWSGVLIEPQPEAFKALAKNRPKCKLYNTAISSKLGSVDFYLNSVNAVSSIKEFTSENHYQKWHTMGNTTVIQVKSDRLENILHHAKITHIDFWSLDVEGGEYEVLKTMDWKIPVYLICIEIQIPERKALCDAILKSNGFIFQEIISINEIWINLKNK